MSLNSLLRCLECVLFLGTGSNNSKGKKNPPKIKPEYERRQGQYYNVTINDDSDPYVIISNKDLSGSIEVTVPRWSKRYVKSKNSCW